MSTTSCVSTRSLTLHATLAKINRRRFEFDEDWIFLVGPKGIDTLATLKQLGREVPNPIYIELNSFGKSMTGGGLSDTHIFSSPHFFRYYILEGR